MRYWLIVSSHRSPLSPSKSWWSAGGAALCSGCGKIVVPPGSAHVVIQNRSCGRHAMNGIQACFDVGVAKEALIAAFHPTVKRQLVYGTVRNEAGRQIRGVVTFRAKHQVLIRGEKHASYRYCSICGDLCYFALGRPYLFPKPPPRVVVFGAGHDGLVIRGDYFLPRSLDGFTGIKVEELAVLRAPLDGFAEMKKPNTERSAAP